MLRSYLMAIFLVSAAGGAFAQDAARAVQQGIEKGFRTCAPLMDRMLKFVHSDDSKYAHLGTWNKGSPDRKTFNTVTVEPYTDGATFTSFSAVRNQADECDVVMTQVIPVLGRSCNALRETTFKGWKYLQDLGGVPLFEPSDDESTTVFLSPLGNTGCLIIKSAVVYGPAR